MRPLELELTAFRSYDRATIDLRPYERVVITGDTGAGKTSLLDAVCFALYGRTPEQTRPRELLTLGHSHGEVRLTFSARGEVWRATRRYGRDAPEPAQLLERLVTDGGPSRETLSGEAAVERRLSAVVGMSFAAFTSAVLLTQGRFAQFLSAQPRDRDAILRELFGVASLEGARQAAMVHAAAAERQADLRTEDAARLPPHGTGARIAAARAARDAAARHGAARALRPVAERLARRRAEADDARAAAAAARGRPARCPATTARRSCWPACGRPAGRRRGRTGPAPGRRRARAAKAEARDGLRERHGGGAAELATLGERAARAEELARGLPARRLAMAEREAALTARRAELDELSRVLSQALAEHERLAARAALVSAWARLRDEAAAAADCRTRAEAEARAAAGRCEVAARTLVAAEREHDRAHRHDLAATLRAASRPATRAPCAVERWATDGQRPPATVTPPARRSGAPGPEPRRPRGPTRRPRSGPAPPRRAPVERSRHSPGPRRPSRRLGRRRGGGGARRRGGAGAAGRHRRGPGGAGRRGARPGVRKGPAGRRAGAGGGGRGRGGAGAPGPRRVGGARRFRPTRWPRPSPRSGRPKGRRRPPPSPRRPTPPTRSLGCTPRWPRWRAARSPRCAPPPRARRPAHRLEAPADDLPAEDLIAAAAALRERALAAAGTHDDEAGEAERGAREEAARLAVLGAGLGVAAPEDVGPALRRCERAARRVPRPVGRPRVGGRGGAAPAGRGRAARAEARVHQQVAADLRANAFPRFLLARYRERLAVGASARLQELTAGAYRFCGTEPDPIGGESTCAAASACGRSRASPAASASWRASPWPWGCPTWRPSRADASTACSWTRGSRRSTPSRSSRRWRASSGLPETVAWSRG